MSRFSKALIPILAIAALAISSSSALAQGGVRGVYNIGYNTASAGTRIEVVVPPREDARTRIMKLAYRAGTTAHTVTLMKPLGRTTVASTAATGQAVVNISANPGTGTVAGTIAANDYLVIQRDTTEINYLVKVSSVSTLAITLTANVPVAFAAGDKVWFYGVPGDVRTNIAEGAMPLETFASTSVTYSSTEKGEGLFTTDERDDPVIVSSDNATVAGFLQYVAAEYLSYGTPTD